LSRPADSLCELERWIEITPEMDECPPAGGLRVEKALLMPARKDQRPRDLRYFSQSRK
jgi:hypothetical protein